MKKGISVWSFQPASYAENFALAKQAGFEGVELSLDAGGELSLSSTKEDVKRLKQSADAAGTEFYSVATGLYWSNYFTSDDKLERERTKDIAKKQLELASMLGCDTILVVPGATGVDFAPDFGVVTYRDAYERALEAMQEMAPIEENYRVSIGVENVWKKFLLSPLEMQRFIDEVGSSFVGSYFDVGNVLAFGYPEHWISILGEKLKRCILRILNGIPMISVTCWKAM